MSPEQARGDIDRLGPRSDVYSLGATLYCLLTGRPPFQGDDAGAILGAVQKGDFLPPRAVDPPIDRALEAVCLKAMAMDPEGRYATPRALAEDVERWMADEPVSAREEPLAERARRWMRRHRTAATAVAAGLVVATLGLAAVLAVEARSNAVLSRANARVQARFDLAMEAIQTFHTGVAEDVLLRNDNLRPVRDRLLKGASEFYRRLGDQLSGEADRASRQALGRAYNEMAGLASRIGATDQAIDGHRRALEVRRNLAESPGADADATADVANSLISLGHFLRDTGNGDEARAALEEARTLLDGLVRARPGIAKYQGLLARSHQNLGVLLDDSGNHEAATASFEAARAIQQRLADANPDVTRFHGDLAVSHLDIGMLLSRLGKTREALASYEAARAIQQRLADANPNSTEFPHDLALTYHSIGDVLGANGKPDEALASHGAARAILQKLADANPAVTAFQLELAATYNKIGAVLSTYGKLGETLASYEAGRAILQKLADANPAVTRFQDDLATSHNDIAIVLRQTGESEKSLAACRAARDIQQRLADANPDVTRFQAALAHSHYQIGVFLREAGEPGKALEAFSAARDIQQKLADFHPEATRNRSELANSHDAIGVLMNDMGKPRESLASLQAALAIRQRLADTNPTDTRFQLGLANNEGNIGIILRELDEHEKSLEASQAARAILQRLADANPDAIPFRVSLANAQLEIGDVLRLIGRPAEARASYDQALTIIERLIKAQSNLDERCLVFLVFGLKGRGAIQQAVGQAAEAVQSWRRAVALCQGRRSRFDGELLYYLAGCHARLGGIAGAAGSGLSAADGAAELDRAMAVLRRAVATGYRKAMWMGRDPDLDPLRHRDDFRALMADLAFPTDPFTPAE